MTPTERVEALEKKFGSDRPASPTASRNINITEADLAWLLRVAKAAVALTEGWKADGYDACHQELDLIAAVDAWRGGKP